MGGPEMYYRHNRTNPEHVLLMARLVVVAFIVALLVILWLATGITSVGLEPLPVPEPGIP
jgi:undecaprenyl pyrophosphate phosphatase UppP